MAESKPKAPLAGDVQATPKNVGPAADLSPEEQEAVRQSDKRDVSPRAAGPDTSGKRVRYIPYKGGTHVELRKSDFKQAFGVDHPGVQANFRNNIFTFEVGDGKRNTLSQEVADLLTEKFPTMFEYLDESPSPEPEPAESK
ncbi:gp28 [Mycobacterium phage Barnyard]|uniref:Uncharacterized protein n=1 Tax=Mycobacterium phage Barnyard TaxID=205880 RepID=Q856E4_9CAUD|nr:gp28 [Mycobacterium phage Barnyard]AAN02082.1 hypothetical protein PBI_BARNYARD_28 [Mycobacterium phage Barnyard]